MPGAPLNPNENRDPSVQLNSRKGSLKPPRVLSRPFMPLRSCTQVGPFSPASPSFGATLPAESNPVKGLVAAATLLCQIITLVVIKLQAN